MATYYGGKVLYSVGPIEAGATLSSGNTQLIVSVSTDDYAEMHIHLASLSGGTNPSIYLTYSGVNTKLVDIIAGSGSSLGPTDQIIIHLFPGQRMFAGNTSGSTNFQFHGTLYRYKKP